MCANVPTEGMLVAYNLHTINRETAMTDVSVDYFARHGGPRDKGLLFTRRATLDAIEVRGGEPVMQSLRVVDHTEVDRNGFLVGGTSEASIPGLWPEIRSLESRTKSRDAEALKIAQSGRKHRLHSESLELRYQARMLRAQVDRIKADELRNQHRAQGSFGYWSRRAQIG